MISVEHLIKYYGDHLAVDDISFRISEGHVYGFLGPNGAGKSTTMNIITGCLSPTSGKVTIDGFDIFENPNEAKKRIGYLPEHPPLYMNETPWDYLRFVAEAKGLRGAAVTEQVQQAVEKTGIDHVKHRRIRTLSKGYKQRVGIAQALLGNPKVIILDEPTVGLDPIQIIEIRELIRQLGKTHTVIFSSHILSEVQSVCDTVLMIAKGKLVAFGTPEELQSKLLPSHEIHLTTDAPADRLDGIFAGIDSISGRQVSEKDGRTLITVTSETSDIYALSSDIFRAFSAAGFVLYETVLKKGNLEDVFVELSESASASPSSETKESEDTQK